MSETTELERLIEEIGEDRTSELLWLAGDITQIQADALRLGYAIDEKAQDYAAVLPIRFALEDAVRAIEEAGKALAAARVGLDRAWREQIAAQYPQEAQDRVEAPLLTPAEEALKAVLHSPAGIMAMIQQLDQETYALIRRATSAEVEAHSMGRDPR